MEIITSNSQSAFNIFKNKLSAYFELLKFKLSLLVVFSGIFGFLLGSKFTINFVTLIFFSLGGFLMTGSSNILNQVLEKDLDRIMKRTHNRPLPSGRISIDEALYFSLFLFLVGFGILISKVNVGTAFLTLTSLILYAFVYTPMKRISPFCVLVGAIPGAMPPLIGWVAASGELSIQAWILFALQFIWQFPHFWAIAWVLDDDYRSAGFKMLPSAGGRNAKTAFQILVYTFFLIPIGLFPTLFHIVGITSGIIAVVCGILFFIQTLILMKKETIGAARQIMFGSFIYLPIIQITFIFDKF